MCTYIHVYTHIYICIYVCIYVCIHAYMYTCIHVYMYTCTHLWIYARMHMYMYEWMLAYAYTTMPKHECTCVYICVALENDVFCVSGPMFFEPWATRFLEHVVWEEHSYRTWQWSWCARAEKQGCRSSNGHNNGRNNNINCNNLLESLSALI